MGSVSSYLDRLAVNFNWQSEKEAARKHLNEYISQLNQQTSRILDNNGCHLLFSVNSSARSQTSASSSSSPHIADHDRDRAAVAEESGCAPHRHSYTSPALPPWNRILCDKVHQETGEIKDSRVLILDEFLRLRYLILEHSTLASQPDEIMSTLDTLRSTADSLRTNGDSLCCVCCSQRVDIVLPCLHSYCSTCISEWERRNPTCPQCRTDVNSQADGWLLSDYPKVDQQQTSAVAGNAVVAAAEKVGVRRLTASQQRRSVV